MAKWVGEIDGQRDNGRGIRKVCRLCKRLEL